MTGDLNSRIGHKPDVIVHDNTSMELFFDCITVLAFLLLLVVLFGSCHLPVSISFCRL